MTKLTMKPIRYDRRQVALMVKVAAYFHPHFAERAGEAATVIRRVAQGRKAPTLAILDIFGLHAEGKDYVWNLR